MPTLNSANAMLEEATAWRRDIHRHPELGFEVERTAGLVAERLRAFGCDDVVTGIGRTGVVGIIKGRGSPAGPAIGLRADMDALALTEITGLPHASGLPGKMHACGHDGHTTMLLGAAKYLAETRNFSGTAVLIFQPSEEVAAENSPDAGKPGGAEAMLADSLMERFGIGQVFGMHNMPGLPVGQFAIRPGGIMAATDFFDITIEGKGSHASTPHQSIDPVYIGCQLGMALQSIVARSVDPLENAVVSLTVFNGSGAKNIIPQSARLGGTVRTLDKAVQTTVIRRFETLIGALETQHGARITLDYQRTCPLTVNDPAATALAARVAADVAGSVDADTRPVMGGEDFSYMLEKRPGAFIFIGNGDSAGLHHPVYDFNDGAIPAGISYWARLVETALPV